MVVLVAMTSNVLSQSYGQIEAAFCSRSHDIKVIANSKNPMKMFDCYPLASYQKGAIESIHRILRYVLQKGTSMDFLTQEKREIVIPSNNSDRRRSNQFMTSYALMNHVLKEVVLKQN